MVDQEVVVLVVPAVAVGSAVVLVADSEAPAPVQEALVATTIDLIQTHLRTVTESYLNYNFSFTI